MSDLRLMIQSTPNPNALKFVVNTPVKIDGNITYKSAGECTYNPLAKAIFDLSPNIREVYFFDNYITVTQNGEADWDDLESKIQAVIKEKIDTHDPHFQVEIPKADQAPSGPRSKEMDQIDAILDQTVRPALQMDGGDIKLINYANDTLQVFYQGACGSCPSSSMGTMKAIENILRDQFNPNIVVELAEA